MGPQVDNPDSFGQFLRRERELREIKLEEIASYTRIKLRSLQAIEQDDFASLPPLAFIRAFVRCYADYIGLGIPDVMLRFDAFVQSRYPELTGEVPMIKGTVQPKSHYLVVLLILVVAALAGLAWWMSRSPILTPKPDQRRPDSGPILGATNGNLPTTSDVLSAPGTTSVRPGTTTAPLPGTTAAAGATSAVPGETVAPVPGETLLPSPEAGATPLPGATPAAGATLAAGATPAAGATVAAPGPVARVEVSPVAGSTAAAVLGPPSYLASRPGVRQQAVITVSDDCWIGYTLDGVKKGEFILKAGKRVRFEAKDGIRLIIGNPNAISAVIHNGATVDFMARCPAQRLNFPAGPDDKACYPRSTTAPAVAPAAPARPPAATRPPSVPPRPRGTSRTPE